LRPDAPPPRIIIRMNRTLADAFTLLTTTLRTAISMVFVADRAREPFLTYLCDRVWRMDFRFKWLFAAL